MKITGFDKIIEISSFCMNAGINAHTVCKFRALLRSDADDYSHMVGKSCEVQDRRILLKGMITGLQFTETYNGNWIDVEIMSYSVLADREKYMCVFQDTHKSPEDICKSLQKGENAGICIKHTDDSIIHNTMERPVIQNNETNFSFIKRLAALNGAGIVVDNMEKNCEIRMINHHTDKCEKVDNDQIIIRQKKYFEHEKQIVFQIDLNSKEIYQIGQRVLIEGEEYYILSYRIILQNAVYYCEYTGTNVFLPEKYIESNSCILLQGKVVDNKDPEHKGRIQVDFNDKAGVRDPMSENRVWIDVSTLYDSEDTGILFIPDNNDIVDVIWNGSGFLVMGVRRNKTLAGIYQDVDKKYVGIASDRYMVFDADQIKIQSGKSNITMKDRSILLETDGSSYLMEEGIQEKTEGEMSLSIGKNMDVDAKGSFSLKGSQVVGEAASGNVSLKGKNILLNS